MRVCVSVRECVSVCEFVSVCVCVCVCVYRGSIISPEKSHGSSRENTRLVSGVRLRSREISMANQAQKLPSST